MFPCCRHAQRRGGDLSGASAAACHRPALAMSPKLLILDEPTEGIQPSIIKDIERVIRTLAQQGGMAILLVEQYYDFARSLADHYVVMSRGEVIRSGRGEEIIYGRDRFDCKRLRTLPGNRTDSPRWQAPACGQRLDCPWEWRESGVDRSGVPAAPCTPHNGSSV
jgi:ABC-type glutathione transport system ATPase component